MVNRNTMQGNSIDERDRIRETVRALVEEYGRKHDERILSEATVSTYNWIARQTLFTPWGKSIFRRSENDREEPPKDPAIYTREIKVPGFSRLCVRLISGAPYYIKGF